MGNDEAEQIIDDILSYNLSYSGEETLDSWIEDYLPGDVGICAEWYVLALSQSGNYNFSFYETALCEYLNKNNVSSASTRLKFALAFVSCGSKNEYIEEALNSSMGKQGIMSIVYGLHLLNNGYIHSEYTVSSALDSLLEIQLSDGGWALRGEVSDVDVTAMTLQAIAPYYSDEKIKSAADKAIMFLSSAQLEDGDYLSYGISNPESGAQVITALSALNIDFSTDDRFIKNGNTLLDGILKYQLTDGSFSHQLEGASNQNATVQVFYSMVSYLRMKDGKSGLYILDAKNEQTDISRADENISDSDLDKSESQISEDFSESEILQTEKVSINLILIILIICLFVISVLVLLSLKKLNFKNFIVLFIFALVLIALAFSLKIQSKEEYYNESGISKENIIGTVTISIKCETAVGKSNNSFIPSDGIILNETEFSISEGDTVYDILIEAARKYSLQIENNGNDKMAYIAGINYIYEFDFGDLSGWMFFVNGTESSVGCTSYVLKDGDKIEWLYTCELGRDIEQK